MILAIDKGVRFEPGKRDIYLAAFIPKSDVIYRFAFALTLNVKAASQLTEWVYLLLSQELQENNEKIVALTRQNEEEIYSYLADIIWRLFDKMKSKRKVTPDSFPLVKLLSHLDDEERFILMVSDIFDLKVSVISKLLKSDEHTVRKKLVKCREHLLVS